MKKILFFFTLVLLAFVACKKEIIYPLAESITFDEASIEVVEGDSKYLYYTILPEAVGDTATVYFSSADESIATVSEWGSVTGVKEGNTTITATVHGKSATLEVDVLKAVITKFTLTYNGQPLPEVLDIPYGDNSISIDITDVKPSNVDLDGMTVSSKDKSIAEAKRDGKQVVITPKGEGETTIVVRGGDVKKEININVKMIHAEKVVIDQQNPEVGLNTTLELTATTTPVDVSLPQRTWSSSNPSVVAVDAETGVVTGKSEGSATITVTVDGKTASCQVKVLYVKPTTVTITPSSKTLVLNDEFQLALTTTPAEVTYPEITWTSSNSSVASVDENGMVTAKGLGSATISAKVDGVVGTSTITVSEFPPITGFDLSASATQVEITKSITLSIKNLEPSGASYGDIKWSIDNTSLASISVNKNTGTCTLTAKDQAGYVTVTAESNGVVKTQKIQITKIEIKSIKINELNNSFGAYAPKSGSAYAKTLKSNVDLEYTVEVTPNNASYAKDVVLSVTPSTGVQLKKVGEVYKLYISSTAKGDYTINATADGRSTNRTITILPNGILDNIELPHVYSNPDRYAIYTYDIVEIIRKQTDNLIPSNAIKITGRSIRTTNYTDIENKENVGFKYSTKQIDYSPNKNVDKVDVEFTIFETVSFSQTIEFYNTFFGLSAKATGPIETNKDTNYQYYIQEGSKTAGCNLIGYNNPKFRFKSSNSSGSTTFDIVVYMHYYNPNVEQVSLGNCGPTSAREMIYGRDGVRLDNNTLEIGEGFYRFKYDFYGN